MKKRLRKKLAICCTCKNKVNLKGTYGQNGNVYWCADCIDY